MAKDALTTYQIAVLHARAHRNFRKFLTEHLKPHNLTVMEWALLGLIDQYQKDGVSVTDLANMLSVKNALASVMVSKQVKNEIVDKVSSKKDSRLRHVRLTAEGQGRLKKIEKNLRVALEEWFKAKGIKDVDGYMETVAILSKEEEG